MRLPWLIRFRLRQIRRRSQTGLLLYGIFNSSVRTISKYTPIIVVREVVAAPGTGTVAADARPRLLARIRRRRERTRTLCMCSSTSKFPKWVALDPGPHDLRFVAFRRRTQSSFDQRFVLLSGDILVAICKPIDAKIIFTKRRSADVWHLGTVSSVITP